MATRVAALSSSLMSLCLLGCCEFYSRVHVVSDCLVSFGAIACIQWCLYVRKSRVIIVCTFFSILSSRQANELRLFIFCHIGAFFISRPFFCREDWQSVGSLHRLHIKRPLIKQSLRGSEVSCSNTINYYWHLRGWAGLHEDMLFTVLCMLGF